MMTKGIISLSDHDITDGDQAKERRHNTQSNTDDFHRIFPKFHRGRSFRFTQVIGWFYYNLSVLECNSSKAGFDPSVEQVMLVSITSLAHAGLTAPFSPIFSGLLRPHFAV